METDPVSEMLGLIKFRIPDNGQSTAILSTVIPVIY
jgi:hypothetical protein